MRPSTRHEAFSTSAWFISAWLVLVLLIGSSALAQVNESFAILDLKGRGISALEAASLTDRLRSELVNTGKVNIVERGQMEAILAEQNFQLLGCTSDECAVEVGQLLGVNKMVAGSVGKVGSTYSIDIRIINVETGKIIRSVTRDYTGKIDNLLAEMKAIAQDIVSPGAPKHIAPQEAQPDAQQRLPLVDQRRQTPRIKPIRKLPVTRPEVALRGVLVYPRSDLTAAEALVWRGQLTVRHNIGERLSWYLLGDVMPATLTRPAGLHLYSGYVQVRLNPAWKTTVGRQVQWDALHTTRFDGLTLDRRSGSFGNQRQITLYAGVTPRNMLGTGYGDAGTVVAGGLYRRTTGPSHATLQLWTNEMGGERRLYAGSTLRRRFGRRITQVADLALDLMHPSIDKIRLRTQVSLTPKIGTYAQYRYARHLTMTAYPMADEPPAPRQAFAAGLNVRVIRNMQFRLGLVQRLGESSGRYLSTRLTWGGLALAWQSRAQTIYGGQYLLLSGQHTLFRKTRVGLSFGTNTYTLYDNQSPAVADLGIAKEYLSALMGAFWIRGTMGRHWSYRLFGQYTQNRYFKQDGRIGLQVSYAL